MKVLILSDVHNNLVNLKKVLDYARINKIKKLICCGDLASQEALDFLNDNFNGEIFYALGNMDLGYLDEYSNKTKYKKTIIFNEFGETEIDKRKIAFVHFPNIAEDLCRSGKYDYVFYGHTHLPWEKKIGKCKMLNPGNATGDRCQPTFAVWDTKIDDFQLVHLHKL